ncbi:efflux RND transporter periplasmic adaptor subunit [Sulfurimonas sp. CS5]|uniref:efflux RND transporter periplasmic adaptor subunit n=1 Tax=Sulfurimonas sp. CS5 TaxID=3391145 RepID=UPI0039E7DF06
MLNKKILTLLLATSVALFAESPFVKGENKMVKLQAIKSVDSVYLGSFLAQGHLPANKTYRIDAPVEGVVEKLGASLYQNIQKRKVLAIIKSPKILELEAIYINLLIEKEYNKNEVARLEPLYKAAVVAKKQFLKAKNTLKKYETQVEFYYSLLQEWGLSKKQVDTITRTKQPIPEIRIYSPIDGKVADLNIFPKMYLQRGEHMMTIVSKEGTHLEIALPKEIVGKLHVNSELIIGNEPFEVESIAAEVDMRTQTIAVHLVPKGTYHILPNEKRNIRLYWPRKALRVASSAVINYAEKASLFVKEDGGYRLHTITPLSRDAKSVYFISKDIDGSEEVVVRGAISLKGALQGMQND